MGNQKIKKKNNRYNTSNKRREREQIVEYADLKRALKESDDEIFLNNLFMMTRNRRYEFKMLVRALKTMNQTRGTHFAKQHGISESLMYKLFELVTEYFEEDKSIANLTEFLVEEHEKRKIAEEQILPDPNADKEIPIN